MVKMTLARDDGVIDRVEGKAAIGLIIKPTGRGDADSAVTLMGPQIRTKSRPSSLTRRQP